MTKDQSTDEDTAAQEAQDRADRVDLASRFGVPPEWVTSVADGEGPDGDQTAEVVVTITLPRSQSGLRRDTSDLFIPLREGNNPFPPEVVGRG